MASAIVRRLSDQPIARHASLTRLALCACAHSWTCSLPSPLSPATARHRQHAPRARRSRLLLPVQLCARAGTRCSKPTTVSGAACALDGGRLLCVAHGLLARRTVLPGGAPAVPKRADHAIAGALRKRKSGTASSQGPGEEGVGAAGELRV
eukprot:4370950-Prymnesium_polylepis.1